MKTGNMGFDPKFLQSAFYVDERLFDFLDSL